MVRPTNSETTPYLAQNKIDLMLVVSKKLVDT